MRAVADLQGEHEKPRKSAGLGLQLELKDRVVTTACCRG
jgi:hypothetical protein